MSRLDAHRRARRTRRGFTLVEVMIALTLLALVSTALVTAFTYSFETKRRVTAINERYHEGRQTMTRMARELRMAFIRPEVPEELRQEDPMMITRFEGREDQIHFATTAHLRIHASAKESDQAEVAYFLGRSDNDSGYKGRTLFRRESKRVDNRPERGGHIWPVIDGVKEFRIEYWEDNSGDDSWRKSWDSHDDPKEPLLPARVRITLELESPLEDAPPIRFLTQAAPRIRRPITAIEEFQPFDPNNPLGNDAARQKLEGDLDALTDGSGNFGGGNSLGGGNDAGGGRAGGGNLGRGRSGGAQAGGGGGK